MPSRNNDDAVEKAIQGSILSNLKSTSDAPIRPNKLRKLVCRNVEGSTWTQFATCLESLVDNGKVFEDVNDEGEQILCLKEKNDKKKSKRKRDAKEKKKKENEGEVKSKKKRNKQDKDDNCEDNNTVRNENEKKGKNKDIKVVEKRNTSVCLEVQIPPAVALHLTRNQRLKLNNIEKNTKTSITIMGWGNTGDGDKNTKKHDIEKDDCKDLLTVVIKSKQLPKDSEEGENSEAAKRQVNFAASLIRKLVFACKKNPQHFIPKSKKGLRGPSEDTYCDNNEEKKPAKKRQRNKFY
mmetsp:Transcript_6489/g.9441  ORF Transcript_6489/g.9441 Transcript_6489/m.9441 type:complete len:294 (+) Transcript_6489:48-929(+)|eukprot:CAMPEP_0195514848 /NCGR_PEP_ID=MMETSP0794_2-20130614/6116_1 /TAXON_ID=515487 /ORGANISM="Stephanopyxis turris, Strain CCMP 815" /LENGTH=293 /DNA_ID=CAMNT_0040643177 /DNA_START=36 /DNA_END=917 /DNA_ORIENTATION=+